MAQIGVTADVGRIPVRCNMDTDCSVSDYPTNFDAGSNPEFVHQPDINIEDAEDGKIEECPGSPETDPECLPEAWCDNDETTSYCKSSVCIRDICERRDNGAIGRLFQLAVGAHDWELADSLIPLSDSQRLNDGLCVLLDSIWFLASREELYAVSNLIRRLIEAGAKDFTRAVLRTAFLASCVSACRGCTMSLTNAVTLMAQRLQERLQECTGDEILKTEAATKVQRFTEWSLKCVTAQSRAHRKRKNAEGTIGYNSMIESQLQLKAFKTFLELAGNCLTGKDYTEAFDAACFPLSLFSSAIDPSWTSGSAASAMQGLLGMLVEGGADNINQCFLEAARFGSTELVRILLQIAQSNGIDLDVDLALGFASQYSKISTMECLVNFGNAVAFLGPLMRAADRGCMQVVQWFVERGRKDMELCLALTASVSSSRIEVIEYLLKHIPANVLRALGLDILKNAGERGNGCLKGVRFLLQSNFLQNAEATYSLADEMSKMEDESIASDLKIFLKTEWSQDAFRLGRSLGETHHLNAMRAIKKGTSPLLIQELPLQLQVAITYFPLYDECCHSSGVLLSQRLRGQLVEAAIRLSRGKVFSPREIENLNKDKLFCIIKSRLPSFLITTSS